VGSDGIKHCVNSTTYKKLSRTKNPNDIHNHLQLAMTSFDDLAKAYEKLKQDYEQLHSEHQKVKAWLTNGKELLRIE